MKLRSRGLGLAAQEAAAGGGGGGESGGSARAAPPVTPAAAPPGPARKRARLPPVDIGISALLGQGMQEAATEAATEAEAAGGAAAEPALGPAAGFTRHSLQQAVEFLRKADPKLAPLIEEHGAPERLLAKTGSHHATLAKAIVFQQLATTAAAKIYQRVLAACGCAELLTPEAVLAAPVGELRGAGLSERKAAYLRDLAAHFADGRLSDARILGMEEEELEAALCRVHGIGVWTAQMHSMFHRGSPDVLPVGDLGVRRGMQRLYGLKELPSPAQMHAIAERWRPFASLGSYYMWKVEGPPAKSKRSKGAS